MNTEIDVVVVGAGPVGLLTAIELSLGGVDVLVLERLAAPSMVLKAGGIGPLGIEALQRRGMAAAIAAAQVRNFAGMATSAGQKEPGPRSLGSRYTGHFAGLILIRTDAQKEPARRGSPVEQQAIDRTHRIGQTKNIFAYRMICKDTIEDKILQLQEKKRILARDLIADDDGFVKSLTRADVEYLFS